MLDLKNVAEILDPDNKFIATSPHAIKLLPALIRYLNRSKLTEEEVKEILVFGQKQKDYSEEQKLDSFFWGRWIYSWHKNKLQEEFKKKAIENNFYNVTFD